MTRRWQMLPGAEPAIHRWGDEYVVHHGLSNDTYRLSVSAGILLVAIMAKGVATANGGAGVVLTDGTGTEICLSALADLGFVTQC
jgi:hypothetical protein